MNNSLIKTKSLLIITIVAILFLSFFSFSNKVEAADCQVTSAAWRTSPGVTYPTNNFFVAGNAPFVYVDIHTTDCVGTTIRVSILSMDYSSDGDDYVISHPINHQLITVVDGLEDFTLQFIAGGDGCVWNSGWDCNYSIGTWTDSSGPDAAYVIFLGNVMSPAFGGRIWNYYYSSGNTIVPNMQLEYDCNLSLQFSINQCDQNPPWQYIPQIFPIGTISSQDVYNNTPAYSPDLGEMSYAYLAPLPGFTDGSVSRLGEFLRVFFTILILVAGVLAFIMIVIGAITYLSSDAFSGKAEGKEMMLNAVLGLILALGSWLILNTINPNLASSLEIHIPSVSLDGDTNIFPSVFTSGTTAYSLPPDLVGSLNLYCPGSGGVSAVPQIIDSFVGKTTYRFGGKGGHLPAGQSFTASKGNSSMCTTDSGGQQQCGTFCPEGSICLDCSGFVNHVRQCAALSTYGGTSSMVGSGDAIPVNMNSLSSDGQSLSVNGNPYTLQPGDLLVWDGHVVIYYGGGQIAESEGSTAGYVKNSNVKKSSLAQSNYKKRITHLIKAIP